MRLVHFSDQPLEEIHWRIQEADALKPQGLWVSDEDDYGWKKWCEDEGFMPQPDAFKYSYEIQLTDDHDVLILATEAEVRKFGDGFYSPDENRFKLNWHPIRQTWDGLIITPYQWELRLDMYHLWYYPWDCASGCIWNPAAIRSFNTC